MEATVVTALIAAAVSLASVAANLYIARRSCQSSIEALREKADLDNATAGANVLKELETESERLRIRCWELIALTHAFETGSHSLILEIDMKMVSEAAISFIEQTRVFLDKWAPAKSELPQGIQAHIRTIRHICWSHIGTASACCVRLTHYLDAKESIDPRVASDLRHHLEKLLGMIDTFISVVSTVRRALTGLPVARADELFLPIVGFRHPGTP